MQGLIKLVIPGDEFNENVWAYANYAQRTAQILSVVRYGGPCQFGDIVNYDHEWLPPELAGQPAQGQGRFVDVVQSSGGCLHHVTGSTFEPAQSMQLTEMMREAELHIEVWSLTFKNIDGNSAGPAPLSAGLILQRLEDQVLCRQMAEKAAAIFRALELEHGVRIYAPTVLELAGDELGAWRHRLQGGRPERRSAQRRR